MTVITTVSNSREDYRTGAHAHSEFMLMIPEQGILDFTDELSGRTTILAERQFLLIPPQLIHSSVVRSARQSHTALYIQPKDLYRLLAETDNVPAENWRFSTLHTWYSSPLLLQLLAARNTLRHSSASPLRQNQAEKLSQLLLLECLSLAAHQPVSAHTSDEAHSALLIREICLWLGHHLRTPPSLDTISEQFHISRRHLTRLFRAQTGLSVTHWIHQQRIESALIMLKNTELSVTDIAAQSGFESPSHFAAIFRKYHDVTPLRWRQQQSANCPGSKVSGAR